MDKIIKNYRIVIFLTLFILLLFHGLNNYNILVKSRYCLTPDSVAYFKNIGTIAKILKDTPLNIISLFNAYHKIVKISSFKPPMFFLTAVPFYIFNHDKNVLAMSNMIYFAILLFSTYGIGARLYCPAVGILSALFLSMFPTVFALSRVLMVDFSLAAMVALTCYLFILDEFNSIKFSLLTGITIGLGSLTKASYFIFLLPLIFYFFLQTKDLKGKKRLINFIVSIVIGLCIAASYYTQVRYGFYHVMFQIKNNISPYYYLHHMSNRQLLPLFFWLFISSFFFCFKEKKYILPIMTLVLLIVFSVSANKQDRFMLPVFPYIAVSISGFVWSLTKIRKAVIVGLVLFSFLQYFAICYGKDCPLLGKHYINSADMYNQMTSEVGLFGVIDEGDWNTPCTDIVKVAYNKNDIQGIDINKKTKIMLIVQDYRIYAAIEYILSAEGLQMQSRRADINADFLRPGYTNRDFNSQILKSDFIVIEKINPKDRWIHACYLLEAFKRNQEKFEFVKSVRFPHNQLCNIYKKIYQ